MVFMSLDPVHAFYTIDESIRIGLVTRILHLRTIGLVYHDGLPIQKLETEP